MLRAISGTTLNIDSAEYLLTDVPDGLLTDTELAQVREVLPDALPGYVVWTKQEPISEVIDDVV